MSYISENGIANIQTNLIRKYGIPENVKPVVDTVVFNFRNIFAYEAKSDEGKKILAPFNTGGDFLDAFHKDVESTTPFNVDIDYLETAIKILKKIGGDVEIRIHGTLIFLENDDIRVCIASLLKEKP